MRGVGEERKDRETPSLTVGPVMLPAPIGRKSLQEIRAGRGEDD